jgi:hypothetical protein
MQHYGSSQRVKWKCNPYARLAYRRRQVRKQLHFQGFSEKPGALPAHLVRCGQAPLCRGNLQFLEVGFGGGPLEKGRRSSWIPGSWYLRAATPKFEVKRPETSGYSNDYMAVPLSNYSASNFAGAACGRIRLKACWSSSRGCSSATTKRIERIGRDAKRTDEAWEGDILCYINKPTVCSFFASHNLLLYQSLPITIPYRYALVRRRKDDPSVGTAARSLTA